MKGKKKILIILLLFLAFALQISHPAEVGAAGGTVQKNFTVTKKISDSKVEEQVGEFDTLNDSITSMDINDHESLYTIYVNRDVKILKSETSQYRGNNKIRLTSSSGGPFTLSSEQDGPIMAIQTNAELTVDNIILDGLNQGQCFFISNNAKVTLKDGTIIQNFIDTPNFDGPPIFMTGGILNIEDKVIIKDNSSNQQGGVIQAYNGTTVNIKGGTFINNKSNKSDGGVIAAYGGLNISGGNFENNSAKKTGGAILIGKNSKTNIEKAAFKNNKASTGGAIYALNDLTLKNSTFENNKANWAGAIFSNNALSVTESQFNGNVAGNQGGAVYINKGDLNIDKSQFKENSSQTGGGAVFIAPDTNNLTKVIDSKFSKNESPYGGGIYLGKDSKLQVEKTEFSGNQAAYGGGITTSLGVNIDKSKSNISINNSRFLENEALQGGGLLTAFPTQIEESVFNKNKANFHPQDDQKNPHSSGNGGAIYVMNYQSDIKSTEFNENWAFGSGAALNISGWTRDDDGNISGIKTEILVNITNNTKFNGNIVEVGQGGAIYVNPYEYAYEIKDKDAYTKLNTDNTTLFLKNMTKHRLFQPPKNYQKFSNLQFDKNSDVKHGILQVESLLNNYDVNYKNEYAIISFDPNGGSGKMDNQIVEFKEDEGKTGSYKLPENKFTPPEGQEFKGWEIDGKEYKVGDTITVDKNIVVKALWTKASNPQQPYKPTDKDVIGGDDRIDTAGKISKKYYSYADNVIIARKDDFPDALTASVLAKALNAPILLTDTNKLDERVASELKRLGVKKAYIIGRENAISEFTESQIKKITGATERIGGSDRYETSSLVAKKVVSLVGKKGRAVVATGQDFADSLSISPYAAKMGYPILLVKQNKVPEIISKTIKDLSINKVYIVGGDSAVSVKLEKALPKLIKRIGGIDRYETSAKIADEFFTNAKKAYMASGQVFADALVIGPVAANDNAPVLLTKKNELPKAIKANIDRVHYENITIVGLENAVSKDVIEAIN